MSKISWSKFPGTDQFSFSKMGVALDKVTHELPYAEVFGLGNWAGKSQINENISMSSATWIDPLLISTLSQRDSYPSVVKSKKTYTKKKNRPKKKRPTPKRLIKAKASWNPTTAFTLRKEHSLKIAINERNKGKLDPLVEGLTLQFRIWRHPKATENI